MRLVLLLLFSIGSVTAQVTCPSVTWLAAPSVIMANQSQSTVSGLNRMADGSFTQYNYRGFTPTTIQRQASVTHFEQNFYSCQGLTQRTPTTPNGWRVGADRLLGTTGHLVVKGDFLGNGTRYGACLTPCTFSNRLLTGQYLADGTLTNMNTYVVGPEPAGIIPADINGDGRIDLVVVNNGNFTTIKGSLSIFLMNANGTLSGPTTIQLTTELRAGTATDLNNDGKIDLALSTGQSGVLLLKGNGDGTFQAAVNVSTTFASGIMAADFNRDGKPDIAYSTTGAVGVLLGNNDGTFQAAKETTRSGFYTQDYLGAGDFNGDNKLDIVSGGSSTGEVAVRLGNGDGTFAAPAYYVVPNTDTYFYVTDFDWDGKLDIVMGEGHPDQLTPAQYTDDITVLFGNGDGTFYGKTAVATPERVEDLAVGDLNGDGKPDAVVATTSGIGVYAGSANGSLRRTAILTGTFYTVTLADLNKDGKLDIAAASGNTSITTFLGNGDGTFQPQVVVDVGRPTNVLTSGDLNGDGNVDLVGIQTSNGMVTVYTRSASGTITTGVSFTSGSKPKQAQVVDLNGDNRLDLVVTNEGELFSNTDIGSVAVFIGNGNGTFQTGVPYTNGVNPAGVAFADLNGDGKPDMAVSATASSGSYRVHVALNRGDGTFGSATTYNVDFGPAQLVIGDFNLDGRKDLIITHCCGETNLGLMAGNGNGTFQAEILFSASGQDQSKVAVADWNGDGKLGVLTGGGMRLVSFVNKSSAGATVVSPAPGSTLGSGTVTFTWSAVTGATKYRLDIGTAAGGNNLFTQETTGTSLGVSGLPTDGRALYVQVVAFVNGAFASPVATTYTAYNAPVPLRFVAMTPCRVMETRPEYNFQGRTGAFGPPYLRAGETRQLTMANSNVCQIPATAKAYVVNVTLVPRGGVDFVTVWPGGQSRPDFWTIRSPDGLIVANSAIVAANSGAIQVYASNDTDLLIDISGYYTDSANVSNQTFYPLTPCRVIETRADYRSPAGPFGPPSMGARETRVFRFPSTPYCQIPQGATAYSVTITAVPPAALQYLTAWPDGTSQPNVSNINSPNGRVLANSVIVPASANGGIDVFTFDATDFLVDINGYFAPDNGAGLFYYPVTQCRVSDSRTSTIYEAQQTRTIAVPNSGCAGIPTSAQAYTLNVTALPGGVAMPFITAWGTGQPRPNASILNAFQGQIVTGSAIIPSGTNGAVDIFAYGRTHVVVEVSGYFGR